MTPLLLAAVFTLSGTLPPDSLGNPLAQLRLEAYLATQDSAARLAPLQAHGWYASGDSFALAVEVPADGNARSLWVTAVDAAGNRGPLSNAVLLMAWSSQPDTLICSPAGRDVEGKEWRWSTGRKVAFSYPGPARFVDAMRDFPWLLGNTKQLATWAPVYADLCRLYGGWIRSGGKVACE